MIVQRRQKALLWSKGLSECSSVRMLITTIQIKIHEDSEDRGNLRLIPPSYLYSMSLLRLLDLICYSILDIQYLNVRFSLIFDIRHSI